MNTKGTMNTMTNHKLFVIIVHVVTIVRASRRAQRQTVMILTGGHD